MRLKTTTIVTFAAATLWIGPAIAQNQGGDVIGDKIQNLDQNQDVYVNPDQNQTGDTTQGRISNPVAEFSGLDKITGRIITFDVYINETVQFGALQVTPRVCYSRPDAEEPKTDTFVDVDEITLDRKIKRIFTGWMFAESPGLNAIEHPVYDVWLKTCKQKSSVPPPKDS